MILVGRLYVQSTTTLFTTSTSAESTHAAEAATEMVTPLNCKCTSYGYCCDFGDSAHSLHTRPVVAWERIASAANHPCTLRPLYWTQQRCLQCQLKWFTRRPVAKSLQLQSPWFCKSVVGYADSPSLRAGLHFLSRCPLPLLVLDARGLSLLSCG